MKLSGFLHNLNFGLKGALGIFHKVKERVAPEKKVHLSYQRLESRAVRTLYAAEASTAATRRTQRHEVLSALRRNTRGLPTVFSRHQRMSRSEANAVPQVLRFDPVKKEWRMGPHARTRQALALDEAMLFGAELRRQKTSKTARRVQGGKRVRSCSAMRSMVAILERRELLAGRA